MRTRQNGASTNLSSFPFSQTFSEISSNLPAPGIAFLVFLTITAMVAMQADDNGFKNNWIRVVTQEFHSCFKINHMKFQTFIYLALFTCMRF